MSPERFQRIKQLLNSRQPDLTVLMERVHKPGNLAAIMRSCESTGAFNIHAIMAEGIPAGRYYKTSGGSRRWVPLVRHANTVEAFKHLQQAGFQMVVAHPDARACDFRKLDYTAPTAFVIGSELYGISEEAIHGADHHVSIPMHGMTESLNVSVCAALLLYEAERQRRAAGMYDHCRLGAAIYEQTLFEWAWPKIARFCQKHDLAYPKIDLQTGELLEEFRRPDMYRKEAGSLTEYQQLLK